MQDWINVFLRKARKKRKELPNDYFYTKDDQRIFYLEKLYDWEVIETICAEHQLNTTRKYYEYYVKNKNTLPHLRKIFKKYGSWNSFKVEVFGSFMIFELTEEQVLKLAAFYNIDTWKMYCKIKKLDKRLPSFYAIQKRFGGFRIFKRLVRGIRIESIVERYIVLKRTLGRVPTITECNKCGVEYSRGVEIMGNEGRFLSTVAMIEECVNMLEGVKNEK